MKKNILILLFSLFSLSIFSQIKKEQYLSLNNFKLDYPILSYKKNNFNFSSSDILKSKNVLFLYNDDLKLSDVYVYSNNTLNYTGSKQYQSTRQIVNNPLNTYKIDSFNPNGAKNFNEAVLYGLIHTIFKSN